MESVERSRCCGVDKAAALAEGIGKPLREAATVVQLGAVVMAAASCGRLHDIADDGVELMAGRGDVLPLFGYVAAAPP